jgi:hypothetical protein
MGNSMRLLDKSKDGRIGGTSSMSGRRELQRPYERRRLR